MKTSLLSAAALLCALLLLLSSPAFAQDAAEDTSCAASGGIVGTLKVHGEDVMIGCPGAFMDDNPVPCTCRMPTGEPGKCRVYACNGKGMSAEELGPNPPDLTLQYLTLPLSPDPAIAAIQKKARAGDAEGEYLLAMEIVKGKTFTPSPPVAQKLFRSAAIKGYAPAQVMLGFQYIWGQIGRLEKLTEDQSMMQAFTWFSKGAAQGDAESAAWLGMMYIGWKKGLPPLKNRPEAYFWLTIAAKRAEDMPPSDIKEGLGSPYISRDTMLKEIADIEKVLTPEEIAAAKKRADDWRPGQPAVLEPAPPSEIELKRQADDDAKLEAERQRVAEESRQAMLRQSGQLPAPAPVPEPKLSPEELKKKAAEEARLAKLKKEEERQQAIEAAKQAKIQKAAAEKQAKLDAAQLKDIQKRAEAGDMQAEFDLGYIYVRGNGVKPLLGPQPDDEKYAGEWRITPHLPQGVMLDQDFSKGEMWYRRAANQGGIEAQYNLGLMYLYGRGIRQDKEEAYYWFSLAAKPGLSQARNELFLNDPGIPPDRIEIIKKRVEEWKPAPYMPALK